MVLVCFFCVKRSQLARSVVLRHTAKSLSKQVLFASEVHLDEIQIFWIHYVRGICSKNTKFPQYVSLFAYDHMKNSWAILCLALHKWANVILNSTIELPCYSPIDHAIFLANGRAYRTAGCQLRHMLSTVSMFSKKKISSPEICSLGGRSLQRERAVHNIILSGLEAPVWTNFKTNRNHGKGY